MPPALIEQLAAAVKTPADFQSVYRQFQKALTERVLQAEVTHHLRGIRRGRGATLRGMRVTGRRPSRS